LDTIPSQLHPPFIVTTYIALNPY